MQELQYITSSTANSSWTVICIVFFAKLVILHNSVELQEERELGCKLNQALQRLIQSKFGTNINVCIQASWFSRTASRYS